MTEQKSKPRKTFWTFQNKIFALCTTILAIISLITWINTFVNSYVDQRVKDQVYIVASKLDSINQEIITKRQNTADSIIGIVTQNIKAIAIDFDVIMTNDQRVEAFNRRNATGIHSTGIH